MRWPGVADDDCEIGGRAATAGTTAGWDRRYNRRYRRNAYRGSSKRSKLGSETQLFARRLGGRNLHEWSYMEPSRRQAELGGGNTVRRGRGRCHGGIAARPAGLDPRSVDAIDAGRRRPRPRRGCTPTTTCGGTPSTGRPAWDRTTPTASRRSRCRRPSTAGGCNPASLYSGNVETDAPASLFTEDNPFQIDYDVQSAIAAGLSGFAVDWVGSGSAGQSPQTNADDRRLDLLVQAVDQAQAQGHNFHLWLSYEASAVTLSQAGISGDLSYLTTRYGTNPAFDRSNNGKPTFIWVGSYKYSTAVVAAISGQFRSSLVLRGRLPVEPVERDRGPVLRRGQPLLVQPGPVEQRPELLAAAEAGRHAPRRGQEVLRPVIARGSTVSSTVPPGASRGTTAPPSTPSTRAMPPAIRRAGSSSRGTRSPRART